MMPFSSNPSFIFVSNFHRTLHSSQRAFLNSNGNSDDGERN